MSRIRFGGRCPLHLAYGLVVVILVLEAGCSGSTTQAPTIPSVVPNQLATIVVSTGTLPDGLHIDQTYVGSAVLTMRVISGRDATFLGLAGFVAGRANESSGEPGILLSLALAFDTVERAQAAFDLFIEEFLSDAGYGWGLDTPAGLGEDGTCAEGPNPALNGLYENACVWRNGRLVLIAGGTLNRGAVHDVAEGMDARTE